MRVAVDMETCIASGMCTKIAPSVFTLDPEGALHVVEAELSADHLPRVEDAVACCPVEALSLDD
jgi:ferredoxin